MDMAISMDFRTMVKGSLRAAVSGVLCVLMCAADCGGKGARLSGVSAPIMARLE
jgi:hypothetical protein